MTEDEQLYILARKAPRGLYSSYGDTAAAEIRSDAYRYAMIASSITGRRTLIHNLAIEGGLDELVAARILLADPEGENKNISQFAIGSEALLMLACLNSIYCRSFARERLAQVGSAFPGRYFEMEQDEMDAVKDTWYEEACDFAERLVEKDKEVNDLVSPSAHIDSSMLVGFLAACHPDPRKRVAYAEQIGSERLAAYVGSLTDDAEVKRVLSRRIHSDDLLELLPYDSYELKKPLLIRETEERRIEFCLAILQNAESEEVRDYLLERLERAGVTCR